MNGNAHAGRRMRLALAGLIAVAGTILVLAISDAGNGHAATHHEHAAGPVSARTAKQLALHDAMRGLWEQHVAWTRPAIVSFAAGNPDLAMTGARLLRNQADIGNAIAPFYGRAAGTHLTTLLRAHITGAGALLQAAKAGDNAKLASARAAWYANARQISDLLAGANPRNWPRAAVRAMMKTHLDQTLFEAVDQLTGRYAAGIREYDAIERHSVAMADTLSSGIVKQFPRRFR